MNLRTALQYIDTELGALGYSKDSRTDTAAAPRSKVYRITWNGFAPALTTINASSLCEVGHELELVLHLPKSGGNPQETTIELAEAAEEAINRVLNIHSLYADPIISFEGAASFIDGPTLKVGLPFNLSYKRS